KAGDDLARVHARLEDLERNLAPDRLSLLGQVDDAEAALADRFQQLVGADHRAGMLAQRRVIDGHNRAVSRRIQEVARTGAGLEQALHLGPQWSIAGASDVQVILTLACRAQFEGLQEEIVRLWIPARHG